MKKKLNYATIGSFVVVLLALLIIMIIWLSAGFTRKHYNRYMLYMNESVSGLNIDSPVKYNGVLVGYVKKITLNPRNPQQVELGVNIEEGTPITEDTRATLNVQGLTGVASIELKNIGSSTTRLVAHDNQKYPVIKTAPSLFNRLDATLTTLSHNISEVSKNIDTTFNAENQKALKEVLQNLNTITASMAMSVPAANQTLNNLQTASDNLVTLSSEIKQNPAIILRGQASPQLGPGEK